YVVNHAMPTSPLFPYTTLFRSHYEPGPRDQRTIENRNDVLVYSTKPLAEDMEVTGSVTLELWAKSSAVDTDFTAKLVDVSPDGLDRKSTRLNSSHQIISYAVFC